ncbi:MAG: sensor histidine kinase [Crocinitomicaceae bacterium]
MLDQYRRAVDIAQMGIWSWNPVSNKVEWSDEEFTLFGYVPQEFEVNKESAFKTVHPDDIEHIGKVLDANLSSENYFEYAYRGVKKQGDIIHVWVRVKVDRDEKGEPVMVHGVSQDRTRQNNIENEVRWLNRDLEGEVAKRKGELVKKNDQNEFLIKEMHHRVKNNLQVISSILNLQRSHIDDEAAKSALDLCVKRIKSMAIIHDSLYRYENLSQIRLQKYVQELIYVHPTDKNIKFHIDVQDEELGLDLMVPIGLILNELIANSCLHAFDNSADPAISIKILFDKDLFISYSDNGSGINTDELNGRPSFGMEMIKTLCNGIEGKYAIASSPNDGFLFKLIVPEHELVAQR